MKQHILKDWVEGLAHLFYPSTCPGCGTDTILPDQLLCITCVTEIPFTGFTGVAGNPVEKIFRGRIPVRSATSLLYFTRQSVVRNLLHQFKYQGNKEIGLYFGRMIGERINTNPGFGIPDLLVPLPLHFSREKKRGYNQSLIICEGMRETMKTEIADSLVVRKRQTQTQTFRNRIERWENIGGGFELSPSANGTGKHLLLVDDVITTGATLEACGTELLRLKGATLSIATLAFTSS